MPKEVSDNGFVEVDMRVKLPHKDTLTCGDTCYDNSTCCFCKYALGKCVLFDIHLECEDTIYYKRPQKCIDKASK